MTNLSIRRARGFTLVELLVVMAIIAILAAAGFAAGNAAIQRAKKASALNVATSLQQAVSNFYDEYNFLPSNADVDTTFATDEAVGEAMLVVLAGKEPDSPTMLNVKSINFLSGIKEGKKSATGGRDGIIYSDSGVPEGIYDPWKGSYKIKLDLNYDDKLEVTPKGTSTARVLNARRVAVWTDGADGASIANGKTNDDVTTW